MKNNYYVIYYTVNKNRDDKVFVNGKNEDNENGYFNSSDFLTPNHYIGRKNYNVMLGERKLRSQINHFNKFILYK